MSKKKKHWMESEFNRVMKNLHMTIPEMIRKGVVENRTYWEIYNLLCTNGYEYNRKKKTWCPIEWKKIMERIY